MTYFNTFVAVNASEITRFLDLWFNVNEVTRKTVLFCQMQIDTGVDHVSRLSYMYLAH